MKGHDGCESSWRVLHVCSCSPQTLPSACWVLTTTDALQSLLLEAGSHSRGKVRDRWADRDNMSESSLQTIKG